MLVLSTQETEMMLGLLWAVHTASIAVMAATAYAAHAGAVSRHRSTRLALAGRWHQARMMRRMWRRVRLARRRGHRGGKVASVRHLQRRRAVAAKV